MCILQNKLHNLVFKVKQPFTQIPVAPANSRWVLPVSCFVHIGRQVFYFVLFKILSVFNKTDKYYRVPGRYLQRLKIV